MGYGSWSSDVYTSYAEKSGRSVVVDSLTGHATIDTSVYKSAQDMFKSRKIDKLLNPYGVIRECCDSEDHPCSKPVILALDVTGSMGPSAMQVASKLNEIILEMFDKVKDIEFSVMAIGDCMYDFSPIQMSQFESDVRIAEAIDKIYFEGHGGGNISESYTAAWYMGSRHCKLDCWNRGQKGVIITIGDETLNPYLPKKSIIDVVGDLLQDDIDTRELYEEVKEKFDVFHIHVLHNDSSKMYEKSALSSFGSVITPQHVMTSTVEELPAKIVELLTSCFVSSEDSFGSDVVNVDNTEPKEYISENGNIRW